MLSSFARNLHCLSVLPAFLYILLALTPVKAQEATTSLTEGGLEIPTFPVVVDGTTLFSVRGISAYPAEKRAKQVASRIVDVASNRALPKESLRLSETADTTQILADDKPIMTVVDADAMLEGVDRQVLARVFMSRIADSIDSFRRNREPAFLFRQALYALAATLAFLLVIVVARRVRSSFEEHYKDKIRGVRIQSLHLIRPEQLWRSLTGMLNLLGVVFVLTAAYLYVDYVLSLFPWTRGLANSLLSVLIDPLRTMGSGLLQIIPDILFLMILTVVTRYLLVLIRVLFDAVESGTVKLREFDPAWAKPTYRLVRVAVIILALVVAYPYIPGSSSEAFKGVSLFIGVLFSLGSTSLIGNIIAGYTLTYRRTFRRGDRVKIGEHIGYVENSRVMATYLRTPKNELVVVPNSKIINEEVVNYSTLARREGLILHTTVGIGYDAPWRQVEAMLLEAAARTPALLRRPKPYVLQKMLGDFAVTYELNVYCDRPRAMGRLYTQLHRNILDIFNEYGVQIMTPAYESDPDETKVVTRDRWYAAPAGPPKGDELRGPNGGVVNDASDDPSIPRAS
jgi:small-conductance mechanosensitive channel